MAQQTPVSNQSGVAAQPSAETRQPLGSGTDAANTRDVAADIGGMIAHLLGSGRGLWQKLSLVQQFSAVATPIMVAGMALLGMWISSRIEKNVVEHTAISTVYYMDNLIEPLVQELASSEQLSASAQAALTRMNKDTALGRQIASLKIWSRSGTIVHSNDADIIGKKFPQTLGFRAAIDGRVHSEFDDLGEDENVDERKMGRPLMEIYGPMHKLGSNDVIGVAEFYLFAEKLRDDIASARMRTALGVAAVTLAMLASLYGIVKRGSTTIAEQRTALVARVDELSSLLAQNENLRLNLVDARKRLVGTNERVMRRIGADLHDGPAQLLGLALLRFNDVDPNNTQTPLSERQEGYELLRGVLEESLEEIRNISYGIAPPHLENVNLGKAIELAARNHEKRTGTKVDLSIEPMPESASNIIKTCLYRFTQEGLSNAFRHAGGKGQQVDAKCNADRIVVEVRDSGQGFTGEPRTTTASGLGLAGLRDRIESLGGQFSVCSKPGEGTRLTAIFDRSLSG